MTDGIKQDLEKILKKLDKIEDIINRPYEYPSDNTPQPYVPETTTCTKCGMVFNSVTSYYCAQPNCPIFMKAT